MSFTDFHVTIGVIPDELHANTVTDVVKKIFPLRLLFTFAKIIIYSIILKINMIII